MNYCFYCNDEEKLSSLMIKIKDLQYSTVFLNRNQYHRGRVAVVAKRHIQEFFEFSAEECSGFAREIALCAYAINDLFSPKKINYATYGDKAPHFHVHIVPKDLNNEDFGRPFDDDLILYYSDEEYQAIVSLIRNKINELITQFNLLS